MSELEADMDRDVEQHLGRPAPDYRLAESAAQKLLKESVITTPPVLPLQIAESYGVTVIFAKFAEKFSKVSGFLDLGNNTIYVNGHDTPNRQTFTIAHELGHAQLHSSLFQKYPQYYQVLMRGPIGSASNALEKEANCFAANLLVPSQLLEKFYKVATPRELSRLFIVSEDIIRWRIQNLYKS
jgi:Zn-dependent peptidase ImmA (M78 family)